MQVLVTGKAKGLMSDNLVAYSARVVLTMAAPGVVCEFLRAIPGEHDPRAKSGGGLAFLPCLSQRTRQNPRGGPDIIKQWAVWLERDVSSRLGLMLVWVGLSLWWSMDLKQIFRSVHVGLGRQGRL